MPTLELLLLSALTLLSSSRSNAYPLSPSYGALLARNIVQASDLKSSYDFVVVGGGTAGLAVASRLSEDPNISVLVLEAGKSGDDVRSTIDVPQSTYYNSFVGTEYDWAYSTSAQGSAANRNFQWPRGKVLGGSTAINGLYVTRPTQVELDAWRDAMSSDSSASKYWGWDNLNAAIKKSEAFSAPSSDVASTGGIEFDANSHGSSGPVHVSYPGVAFPIGGSWVPTLEAVGVPRRSDSFGGRNDGGFVTNIAANPTNWTRAYARAAYIDPLPPRSNLAILAGMQVTKVNFDGTTAKSVEYASGNGADKKTVSVGKEVLMAAGVIGTPQVLQLSGVGPKDVVTAAGISSVLDLAGVGHHLQDHIKAGIIFSSSSEDAGVVHAKNDEYANSSLFRSYISSQIGFVNLTGLVGSDGAASIKATATGALDASASMVPSGSSEVVEGYKAIYNIVTNFFSDTVGQIELLMTDMFPGSVTVQAALMHPLSAGRLYINSSSAFDPPVIDPQYLSHPTDLAILREGLKLARKIGQTEPLKQFLGDETTPGSSVQTDDDWNNFISQSSATSYHPCGTAAMLPKEKGGVVDAQLMVYGLNNVRVVDASIYPFVLTSHLAATTYGLAEQAATIIKDKYSSSSSNGSSSNGNNQSSSPSSAIHLSPSFLLCSAALPFFLGSIMI